MPTLGSLAALAALALFSVESAATIRDDFLYGHGDGGANLPFRYFVPPGYNSAQAYPVILFLHGSGERGDDNEAQLGNNANGAMALLGDDELALQPVFMIAPQCPDDGWWSGATLGSAIDLIDQVAADYHIDPDRIYVTGVSMGGMGAWSAVAAQPGRFAAAVPMSGGGDSAAAASVAAVPFWFFHAADDPTVDVNGSDQLVTALRDAGDNVIYTRYDTGGHAIWPVAYAHPLLFAWLIAQQRGDTSTVAAPVLRITSPSSADDWSTTDATIDLGGSADHADNPIDAVNWDVIGGDSGEAGGSNRWRSTDIPLADGENLIRVIATAPTLHADYGGHTTFNDNAWISRVADRIFADRFGA